MSNLMAQAQAAARRGDWAATVYGLQQLWLTSDQPTNSIETNVSLNLALQVLREGDFQEQWDVAKVFPVLGEAAIAELSDLLQDDTAELESRWFAARILGHLNNPSAIRVLVEQLQASDDEDLSKMAAGALAELGVPAIAALADLLTQADTRSFAIQALSQIRKSETVTPLLTVVADPQPAIRATAIDALSSFHDPRVPPVLLQAIADPAAIVRRAAIVGLSVRDDLINELNLVEVLSERLWDLNVSVCQQAALALGRLKQDAAIPALDRALHSTATPTTLRLEVIRAIGWIGTPAALKTLQDYLTQTTLELPIYQELITTLGRWANPDLKPAAAQILITALQLTTPQAATLRPTIAAALGELKQPTALEPLTQMLAAEDASLRLHAIAALKQLDSATVQTYLQDLQAQVDLPENLRQGIEIALQEW